MDALTKARKDGRYSVTVVERDGKKFRSQGCKDEVAQMMLGKNIEEVFYIVEQRLDLPGGDLAIRYAHLNNGQKRMNAGNLLRAHMKRLVKEDAV